MKIRWREVFKFLSGAAFAGSIANFYLWLTGIGALLQLHNLAAAARRAVLARTPVCPATQRGVPMQYSSGTLCPSSRPLWEGAPYARGHRSVPRLAALAVDARHRIRRGDRIDMELSGDLGQRLVGALVAHRRPARDDAKRPQPREVRDQCVGHPVGEVFLRGVARQVVSGITTIATLSAAPGDSRPRAADPAPASSSAATNSAQS